jgi:hypothetical protein
MCDWLDSAPCQMVVVGGSDRACPRTRMIGGAAVGAGWETGM